MAMGRRKEEGQESLFVATGSLQAPRHVFYERLDRILSRHGFDAFVYDLCRPFYAEKNGRPGLAPGVYFRTLFIGYFEGIDSERGMAWRIEDSLSLRAFLGFTLSDSPPDHSTLSRNLKLLVCNLDLGNGLLESRLPNRTKSADRTARLSRALTLATQIEKRRFTTGC